MNSYELVKARPILEESLKYLDSVPGECLEHKKAIFPSEEIHLIVKIGVDMRLGMRRPGECGERYARLSGERRWGDLDRPLPGGLR